MTIKVCHLTSTHQSDDVRIFQKECVSIAQDKRFSVTLIAPGTSRIENSVSVVGVGQKPKTRLKRLLYLTKRVYLAALENDADIYHFHDPELIPYGVKLVKKGKIVIFDSHEFTVKQIANKGYLPRFIRPYIAALYRSYEKYACKKFSAVIVPCTYDGSDPFSIYGINSVVIGNVPILGMYRPSSNRDPKYDVLCAGTLTTTRGITELLKACKMANAKLVLAGTFNPPLYRDELQKEGLLAGVEVLGKCKHEEIAALLNQSRICVSTIQSVGQYPHIDNLPTKVYEAMAMRLPMVLSNFPFAKMLNNYKKFSLLVDPSNITEISDAIKLLLANPKLCDELSANGRLLAEEKFNWEAESQKLIHLYLELSSKR